MRLGALMAEFSMYRHERYPGVDMLVGIEPTVISDRTVARVSIFAEGDLQARTPLIEDLKRWTDRHRLVALQARANLDCCRYVYELKGWNVLADFIVVWIGVDTLAATIHGRDFLEQRIYGEVRALAHQVEALTSKIACMEVTASR